MSDSGDDAHVPNDAQQLAAASAFAAVLPPTGQDQQNDGQQQQNNGQQQQNNGQQQQNNGQQQQNMHPTLGNRLTAPPGAAAAGVRPPPPPPNPNPPTASNLPAQAAHDPQIISMFVNMQQQMHHQAKQYQQQIDQLQKTIQFTQQQIQNQQATARANTPTTPTANPAGQLPAQLAQNITKPPPDKEVLLQLDGPLIDLPPFPYEQLENSQCANVTRTKEHTTRLRGLYKDYKALARVIAKDEYMTPHALRQQFHKDIMNQQRREIYDTYSAIEKTRSTIEAILKVQQASRPTLPTPFDYNDNPTFRIEHLTEFLKNSQQPEPGTEHETIWTKTVKFANNRQISHKQFLLGLSSYLTGDAYEFLEEIDPKTPLEQIANEFANRFVTTNKLADAQQKLENFQRNGSESIRVVKSRLESLIKKALVMHPPEHLPGMMNSTMTQKLKQVVHEKTRAQIKKKEDQYRKQGLTLPIDDLVELINDIERRNGIPKAPVSIPVSLYNTEVVTEQPDETIQAILETTASIHNMWIGAEDEEGNDEETSAQVNAAVNKNVRFKNPDEALKKLRNTADALKTYRTQQKLSNSYQKGLPAPPPRPPTPGPSAAPMDTSEGGHQSRSRDPAPNANSRSDSERRRLDYRRRSNTYDAYLRARSNSKDPTSRQRALTPTSYKERQDMNKLKEENERLRKMVNHHRSRSRNRDENSSGSRNSGQNNYSGNSGQNRDRSQSRNRYGNNSGYNNNRGNNGYNNYSRSNSANRGQPTVNAYDGSTINMTICNKCGISGLHTPQMCNQIVAVRTGQTSEN